MASQDDAPNMDRVEGFAYGTGSPHESIIMSRRQVKELYDRIDSATSRVQDKDELPFVDESPYAGLLPADQSNEERERNA